MIELIDGRLDKKNSVLKFKGKQLVLISDKNDLFAKLYVYSNYTEKNLKFITNSSDFFSRRYLLLTIHRNIILRSV